VKKFIADIWNRGEIDLIPSVCSTSLRINGNTGFDRVGHDGLARMVSIIRSALSDYHCEIHSMVVENNKAFCRLRFTGKHVGTLMGYAGTGHVVAWMGATEFTIQNNKILKVWELGDIRSLLEQLTQNANALNTPNGAGASPRSGSNSADNRYKQAHLSGGNEHSSTDVNSSAFYDEGAHHVDDDDLDPYRTTHSVIKHPPVSNHASYDDYGVAGDYDDTVMLHEGEHEM
jgi:predicted ester cyclase